LAPFRVTYYYYYYYYYYYNRRLLLFRVRHKSISFLPWGAATTSTTASTSTEFCPLFRITDTDLKRSLFVEPCVSPRHFLNLTSCIKTGITMMPTTVYKYMGFCTFQPTFFLTNKAGSTTMLPMCVVHGGVCAGARLYLTPCSFRNTYPIFINPSMHIISLEDTTTLHFLISCDL
jgi:hypothetical protein